jgi:hypothetical protein
MKTTRVALAIPALLVGVAVLAPGTTTVSASFARSGFLQVDKECSEYQGQPGQFCTITSSNISEITPGSKVLYTQPAGIPAGMLDSNVVLDAGDGQEGPPVLARENQESKRRNAANSRGGPCKRPETKSPDKTSCGRVQPARAWTFKAATQAPPGAHCRTSWMSRRMSPVRANCRVCEWNPSFSK